MMNHIAQARRGLVYGTMNPPIHVSGHASAEELKLVLNLVRPRYFVPIHGEYRQLAKHAQLAAASAPRRAWKTRSFSKPARRSRSIPQGARKGEKVTVGRVCIDSGSLDDVVEDMVIRDRRHLVRRRLRAAHHRHQQTHRQERRPAGNRQPRLVSMDEGADLLQEARRVVAERSKPPRAEERSDWGVMQEKIRADLKRFSASRPRAGR